MVAKEVLSQYFFPNRSFLESNLRSDWSPNKAVKRYLFRDGFCFCHCFGTDFVFVLVWGRILFLSLFRDGFCFCYCFGTDFIFFFCLWVCFFCLFRKGSGFLQLFQNRIFPESHLRLISFVLSLNTLFPSPIRGRIRPETMAKTEFVLKQFDKQNPSPSNAKNKIRPQALPNTKSVPKQ